MNAPGGALRSGRRQLVLVASLFLIPLATAVLLYFSTGWRPVVNAHGMLIDPPRPLALQGAAMADGRPVPDGVLAARWSVVHPVEGDCGARTHALLEELSRVRRALDKDADRVRRVLVHDGRCTAAELGPGESDLLVLAAPGSSGAAFRAQFPPAVDGTHGIYIVDPHGNLMMSYPASGSARGLLKDLERLLRLSSIG